MDKNKNNVAVSALYTAATWQWGGLPMADLLTPTDAAPVFKWVNAYMRFYRWINPRTYSLQHQLLHRHTAINHLLKRSGLKWVIEIASGFSPRGAAFSAQPDCNYLELDLPEVVEHKRKQLLTSTTGQQVLARSNYSLQAGNVLELDFETLLNGQPAAVITEGLMMYFPRKTQLTIWKAMAQGMKPAGGLYLFDYIPLTEEPARSLTGRILHWLRVSVFRIKGDFAYDERDRHAVAEDLKSCGFDQVTIHATGEVASQWALPQSATPSRTLVYACEVNAS